MYTYYICIWSDCVLCKHFKLFQGCGKASCLRHVTNLPVFENTCLQSDQNYSVGIIMEWPPTSWTSLRFWIDWVSLWQSQMLQNAVLIPWPKYWFYFPLIEEILITTNSPYNQTFINCQLWLQLICHQASYSNIREIYQITEKGKLYKSH